MRPGLMRWERCSRTEMSTLHLSMDHSTPRTNKNLSSRCLRFLLRCWTSFTCRYCTVISSITEEGLSLLFIIGSQRCPHSFPTNHTSDYIAQIRYSWFTVTKAIFKCTPLHCTDMVHSFLPLGGCITDRLWIRFIHPTKFEDITISRCGLFKWLKILFLKWKLSWLSIKMYF